MFLCRSLFFVLATVVLLAMLFSLTGYISAFSHSHHLFCQQMVLPICLHQFHLGHIFKKTLPFLPSTLLPPHFLLANLLVFLRCMWPMSVLSLSCRIRPAARSNISRYIDPCTPCSYTNEKKDRTSSPHDQRSLTKKTMQRSLTR